MTFGGSMARPIGNPIILAFLDLIYYVFGQGSFPLKRRFDGWSGAICMYVGNYSFLLSAFGENACFYCGEEVYGCCKGSTGSTAAGCCLISSFGLDVGD